MVRWWCWKNAQRTAMHKPCGCLDCAVNTAWGRSKTHNEQSSFSNKPHNKATEQQNCLLTNSTACIVWLFCVVGGVCCLCPCWCLFPCCVVVAKACWHMVLWWLLWWSNSWCGVWHVCVHWAQGGAQHVCANVGHPIHGLPGVCVPPCPSCACVCVVVPCHPHMLTTLQPFNQVWPMGCVVWLLLVVVV